MTNTQSIYPETAAHSTSTPEVAGAVGEVVQKLPLLPTFRKLKVGESATFPIEQYSSVFTTKARMKKENARIGWDAEIEVLEKEFKLIITRTK